MGKRPIRIFLITAILSFLLLFPTYFRYTSLSETTLFPIDSNFENPDQDDQLDHQQHESGAILSSVFSIIFLPGTNLIEQLYLFPFQLTSHSQSKSILRC
jgi:hypothetical protein